MNGEIVDGLWTSIDVLKGGIKGVGIGVRKGEDGGGWVGRQGGA